MMTDDQYFLLLFIMGTYFSPDIKEEKPKKSAMQRIAEGLPSYTSDQLTGSQLKMLEMEKVYLYVLRNSDQSVKVKPTLLHQIFQGSLSIPVQNPSSDHLQFPYLFPPKLHPQLLINIQEIIENVIFINNPEISYIKPDNIERFKRLTRLDSLVLDRDAALHPNVLLIDLEDDKDTLQAVKTDKKCPLTGSSRSSRKRKRANKNMESEKIPISVLLISSPMPNCNAASFPIEEKAIPEGRVGPAMMFFPTQPTVEEWKNIAATTNGGIALTGTAAKRPPGPLVGLVDIGECDDAYFFRVSIPGVIINDEEFSCKVESNGKVSISAITSTGMKRVYKCLQVFEMQTQNLCPPRLFSVIFKMPGPVDSRKFAGYFGMDGLLEGIVEKAKPSGLP